MDEKLGCRRCRRNAHFAQWRYVYTGHGNHAIVARRRGRPARTGQRRDVAASGRTHRRRLRGCGRTWRLHDQGHRHSQNAELHAYVARTDPNLGVYTGAQRSHFVDPNWERTRSASAGCTYVDGEFDNTGSLTQRGGTLNGIATAEDPSVHVAGGYFVINGRKSPYSSAGPARSGPLTLRRGPDFVLPGDETFALQGIRAGGTRSGSVFRLVGTSTAAPQLAREVARGPLPAATRVPTTPAGIAERGGGDLEPP